MNSLATLPEGYQFIVVILILMGLATALWYYEEKDI